MDLNLFRQDNLQRRWLLEVDAQTALTDAELTESGVTLEEVVDGGEDFSVGGTGCASLRFEIKDMGSFLPELTGRELRCYAGIQTDVQTDRELARTARTRVLCKRGDMAYGGFERAPYLRIWKRTDGVWTRQVDPAQPPHPVGALLAVEGKLYCCHEAAPYLSAYTLGSLTPAALPALTAFARYKARWYAERGLSLNRQGERVTEYRTVLRDQQPQELEGRIFTLAPVGFFVMEKPEKKNETITDVTAYDRMGRFDRAVDDWLSGVEAQFDAGKSIPLYDMLKSLCAHCGVALAGTGITNGSYPVKRNFSAQGLTGRQVLQWITQAAASFARITPDGALELAWYADRGVTLTEGDLTAVKLADYRVSPLARIQVRSTENDIGVIVPADVAQGNTYVIQDNPLLYAETDGELRPWARNIFNAVKNFVYRPCTLTLQKSQPLLRAGDRVTLELPDGSREAVYIMSRKLGGGTDQFASTGNQERAVEVSGTHYQIQRLRGSTNELSRTIDETASTLTKYQKTTDGKLETMQTSIKQNATSITSKVSQTTFEQNNKTVNSKFSAVEQRLDGVTTTVQNPDGSSTTSLKADSVKFAFNGIAQGKTAISADGLVIDDGAIIIKAQGESVFSADEAGDIRMRGEITCPTSRDWRQYGYVGITMGDGQVIGENLKAHFARFTARGDDDEVVYTGAGVATYDNEYAVLATGGNGNKNAIPRLIIGPDGIVRFTEGYVSEGFKKCAVYTKEFGEVHFYCYETMEVYLGDIGEDVVRQGMCKVPIDPTFAACASTDQDYYVFLSQMGKGSIYVAERKPDYFIVQGDDMPFAWEIKAKRSDFETMRGGKETSRFRARKTKRNPPPRYELRSIGDKNDD